MSLVTSDVRSLTAEQIKDLASDQATLRTAVELSRGEGWGAHGRSAEPVLLWAEFPESRRDDIHTTVALPEMRVACTCTATRFPCRHAIALLLRHCDGHLPQADPPARFHPPAAPRDAEPAGDPARRAALIAGMADLNIWLGDLARQGMAGLPTARRDYWLAAADRLVDAYAFEAARELRECAALPAGGVDWPERLLPRLGRLALLCGAFARFDDLTPAEQGDALVAAGQPPALAGPPVAGRWLVAGRRFEIEGKQRRERVWLYGADSGRWALLAETVPMGQQHGVALPPGATAAGELAYLPSGHPLQAVLVNSFRIVNKGQHQPTVTNPEHPAPANQHQPTTTNPDHSIHANQHQPTATNPDHSTGTNQHRPTATNPERPAATNQDHLAAARQEQLTATKPNQPIPTTGIAALFRAYSAALAANPWLRDYPAALSGLFVEPPRAPAGEVWRVRDRAGHTVPLPARFSHGWHLLALAADRPLTLFGEWDGREFTPLSVLDADGWRSMAAWRGLS